MLSPKISILIAAIFVLACSNSQDRVIESFNNRITQIQSQFVPDKSLDVFEAGLKYEEDVWKLEGESSNIQAHAAVIEFADSLLQDQKYVDLFHQMPYEYFGDSTYAIVSVSVAPLRREPRHASEMIDQAIMGNTLRLLKRRGGYWHKVQTHYGYTGWMTGSSFERSDEKGVQAWENGKRKRVDALVSYVYSKPSEKSYPVCDVVLNSTLEVIKTGRTWSEVRLPDGRTGFINSGELADISPKKQPSAKDILDTARRMTGVPYLWGGNSAKGNDCSGFTQTTFKAHGIQLPRDARQQVFIGEEVVPEEDFSNVKPADLLFFGKGERITHVGISLGGYLFIHQDTDVNIDSFNKEDDNFNARRKNSLRAVRRIF